MKDSSNKKSVIKLIRFVKDKNILNCDNMNDPPIGDTDIGRDGFNINLDLLKPNQQYVFEDYFGDKNYILYKKDNIWNMIQISDEPFKVESKQQNSASNRQKERTEN